jgi:uncharacterized membrane protein YfcA
MRNAVESLIMFLPLHLLRACWLPVASFFAGVLNTIAGGGSFLSLPALLASSTVVGVGAVSAQATNTVALWPGQLTSLLAFRQQLRAHGWKLLPLAIASGAGGELGGMLLLHTGNKRFRELLPWLLLFAATMFVLSFPLGRWLASLSGGKCYNTTLIAGMMAVSVYVGYFGAGGGFLAMALFGVCGIHDVHEMNALKVLTAAVSIGIPSITFIVAGRVEWRFCLIMAFLAAIGGYLGAHYSRKVNRRAMRWAVAIIGFATAAWFFCKTA